MALDLSKLNFFSRLDARSRVIVLIVGVIGIIVLIYVGTQMLSDETSSAGPSRVAAAPPGMQSVPGGELTPEYYRALQESNVQAAKAAQMSGGSAVPTMVRVDTGVMPGQSSADCTVVCPDQTSNVKTSLDDWLKRGTITPEVAKSLQELADKNVIVSEYADFLDQQVKAGKLTPDQARELLAKYEKQHTDALAMQSAQYMDDQIKAGQMPLATANMLLQAQKDKINPSDYSRLLQDQVNQGKLTPGQAQQLLTQYTQQRAKEVVAQSIASLRNMSRAGQITGDVEKELTDLETRMVSLQVYDDALQRNIKAGKLTPAVADKIRQEFKSQKDAIGPSGSLEKMQQNAEAAAEQEISDLLKAGRMSQEVAGILRDMIRRNVTLEEFTTNVNNLVQQNKLSSDIAKLKIADYQAIKGARVANERLNSLQANNASASDYAAELKKLVQAGAITPQQAVQLMQEYQAAISRAPVATAGAGSSGFARLQQQVQEGGATAVGPAPDVTQFAVVETQSQQESLQQQQERLQNLTTAMAGQAGQLVASWAPPVMANKTATASTKTEGSVTGVDGGAAGSSTTTTTTTTAATGPVIIKAGTIMFAVLDTEVNSDYPDSPVLATIVEGKYKGAKLMGKLTTVKGVAGQMDRVGLNFTIMNTEEWPKSKAVTAYGIDPEKARTVMATDVNYHYFQRFGAIMATSFLQGYSSAITNAGTSSTTTTGMTSTHPQLNPSSKLMVGLGQVGTTLGGMMQNYINIPPTVKVDSGVGLGILFMSDVTV